MLCLCVRPALSQGGLPATGEPASPQPEALVVRVRNCSHVTREGLLEHLEIELATLGRTESSAPVQIRVDCVSSAMIISAEVADRSPLTRRLEGDPLDLNERKVSLAASELVADLWGPAEADVPPNRAEPAPPAATSVPDDERTKPRRAFAQMGGMLRSYRGPPRTGFAGVFGFDQALLPHLEIGALASFGLSAVETDVAEVRQTVVAVAPRLRLAMPVRRVTFLVGVRVPVGLVRLVPDSFIDGAEEHSVSGPWASVLGDVGVRLMTSDRFFVSADGFVGGVVLPVTGTVSGVSVVGVDGLLAGANFGIGLSF